jgi:uncharacterized protein YihD (DUF1040 family)
MRNPHRISIILELLRQYWEANPDLRLAQIIGNACESNDPYYMEDDVVGKYLRDELMKNA